MPRQLLLPVRLHDIASFENFFPGQNLELVSQLIKVASNDKQSAHMIYFYGDGACGKTHLLHAVCRLANQSGLSVGYVPLGDENMTLDVLEDMAVSDVVCLDDIHKIAGKEKWERAILDVYEQSRARAGNMIVAGDQSLENLPLSLADLKSRLASELSYGVMPLTDNEKSQALKLRAQTRGIKLPQDVISYVLKRYPRDTHSLFGLLDQIDDLSLTKGRRVTIPLIRELELSA